MNKTFSHKEILNIFKYEDVQKQIDFIKKCPPSTFKDTALTLVNIGDQLSKVMVLSSLTQGYCHGANCKLGVEIAQAGHDFARELYKILGPRGSLLLYTVSGFGASVINAYNHLGQYEETLKYADDIIPYYEKLGDTENLPSIRVGKIEALVELYEIDLAKKLLAEEKTRTQNAPSSIELARLQRKIKIYTQKPTDIKLKATNLANDSLYSNKVSNKEEYDLLCNILDQGTNILTRSGGEMNEWKAKKILRDASAIFLDKKTERDPKLLKKSLKALEDLRKWTKDYGSRTDDNFALWSLYLCYNRLNKPSEAADMLQELRESLEELRAGISNPMERGGVTSPYKHLYPALCQMLYESNRKKELLDAIEGSKGRAVADLLTMHFGQPVDDRQFIQPTDKIIKIMKSNSAHYLSYFVDDDITYAVIVTKDGSIHNSDPIQIGKQTIRDAAENVDPRRWGKCDSDDPLFGERIKSLSKELSPLLDWLEPLAKKRLIKKNDHICYSPDEHLHHIPLHYINFKGEPLVKTFSVSRIHGAYLLPLILKRKKVQLKSYVSVIVPTKQNLEDKDIIDNLHKAPNWLADNLKGKKISNEKARIKTMANLSMNKKVVHFAMHGIFPIKDLQNNLANPYKSSGLVMAGKEGLPDRVKVAKGKADEIIFTPEKIIEMDMDFTNSHVTLQACVSGLAREGIGGDALGLEWALLQKGAASILSSHWSVSAGLSAKFFIRFYNYWLGKKKSRAIAWRKTILDLMKEGEPLSKPYSWAAFSLSGDWR